MPWPPFSQRDLAGEPDYRMQLVTARVDPFVASQLIRGTCRVGCRRHTPPWHLPASPSSVEPLAISCYLFLNDGPLSLLFHFPVISFHPFHLSLSSILYLGQCPRLFNSDKPLAMPF
jgi:hypothetical protein